MSQGAERFDDNEWSTWKQMLDWRDVWLKAVALAWEDASFKEHLLRDARGALRERLGYELPRFLDFKVVDHGQFPEAQQGREWGWQGPTGEWRLPEAKLTFPLPPPPTQERHQAVALADFARAGRTYPFTTI
ncbi:BMA_0021/BMA_0022 family TOMM bacteriocin [Myxococcaceae bacterium GXIMD 01537]